MVVVPSVFHKKPSLFILIREFYVIIGIFLFLSRLLLKPEINYRGWLSAVRTPTISSTIHQNLFQTRLDTFFLFMVLFTFPSLFVLSCIIFSCYFFFLLLLSTFSWNPFFEELSCLRAMFIPSSINVVIIHLEFCY